MEFMVNDYSQGLTPGGFEGIFDCPEGCDMEDITVPAMDMIDDTLERDMIDRWMRLHTTRRSRYKHSIKEESDLDFIKEELNSMTPDGLEDALVRYSVDRYGRINVYGDCLLHNHRYDMRIAELPFYIRFNIIKGDFYATDIGVKNMNGFPSKVYGDFNVSDNRLKSLKGGPFFVKGRYIATNNKLRSYKGIPSERLARWKSSTQIKPVKLCKLSRHIGRTDLGVF